MATETIEKFYDKDLQRKIKDLIDSGKVNASTIAKGVNKSSSTLSLYLKSNYDGVIETLEDDLKKYLSFFDKKEQTINKSLNFVDTSIVNKLFSAASMCQLKGKMGVCYGAPGIGKTTAVIQYQKNNTGVIVVDPIEQTSIRAVLEEISDQLKLHYENNTSAGDFIEMISKKLYKNKHLIIIDEAENLKVDSFKIIRKIFDKSKEFCGILFVGTYDLFEQLKRVKCGFPYITSRIGYVAQLDALNINDISNLVLQYYPNCNNDLINRIAKVCNNNARAVQNLLDICFDVTSSKNIDLNTDIVETAREMLLI